MKANKCKALGCNRKTRTPFCWQHADMDYCWDFEHAPQLSQSLRWKAIRNEFDAYITETVMQAMKK